MSRYGSPLAAAILAMAAIDMLRERPVDDDVIIVGGDDRLYGYEPPPRRPDPEVLKAFEPSVHDVARMDAAKRKRERKAARLAAASKAAPTEDAA